MHIRHISIRAATAFALMLGMTTLVHAGSNGVAEAISARPASSHTLLGGFPLAYDFVALSALKPGDGVYVTLVPGDRVRLAITSDQFMLDGFHRLAGSIEDPSEAIARGHFSITLDRAGQSITGTAVMDDHEYGFRGTGGRGYIEDTRLDHSALMQLE
ncbi:hypothetical protein [Dyella sp. 2RAB6]|uniref:hypothetical protein n=1 Tax=Dyella sp. 2RAB6 TaxID=3232992 RepID=UPI003F8E5691